MMEKPDNKQPQQAVTQQYAMIWNYNAHVEHQNNYYGTTPQPATAERQPTETLTREQLGRAVKQVERLMWGQSAYAVIYCTVRDLLDYEGSATTFEADINAVASRLALQYPCPPNTISSAIYNNPYMKHHVDKWESRGVKPRSVALVKAFIQAVKSPEEDYKF